jgi:hypothetical protein
VALTLGLGLATFATESGFREVVHLQGLIREEEVVAFSSKDSRAARGCSHFGSLNSL